MAAICAANGGAITPGRKATRNLSRVVCGIRAAVVSQESSQSLPVGVNTASNPADSAARAT